MCLPNLFQQIAIKQRTLTVHVEITHFVVMPTHALIGANGICGVEVGLTSSQFVGAILGK